MDLWKWNEERLCWTVKETDGYLVEVIPFLFDRFGIVMTPKAMDGTYQDRWDYDGILSVVVAVTSWDPPADWTFTEGVPVSEPEGWIRHLPTGRRRKDGDPSTEEIRH